MTEQYADTPLGPLLFIGAGNMGGAIARGVGASGLVESGKIAAVARSAGDRTGFGRVFTEAGEANAWLRSSEPASGVGVVMLAVKPQMLREVAEAWSGLLDGPRLVISVLAGVRSERVREALGGANADVLRVVRAMPNTPAQVSLGCSAIAAGAGALSADVRCAERLFGAVGEVVRLEEDLIDAFTAVAGSGPAYVFYLAEAMARGAARVGLPADAIDRIVSQTIRGSAELLASGSGSPAELRARVTSKNGTTHAATSTFDELGVMASIEEGIVAARDRGRELASES